MNRKVLAIDYLRGLSILSLILVHLILPLSGMPLTEYAMQPVLVTLRDLLNLCVVTLVACSGFSLFRSTAETEFTVTNTRAFYRKRFARLLLPWVHYVLISVAVYGVVALFFPGFGGWLLRTYPFLSVANYGGIPFAWIALKWIVILLLLLTLLFPWLRHVYRKQPVVLGMMIACYIASCVLALIYPVDRTRYRDLGFAPLPVLLEVASFVLGWSLVCIFGFSLDKLYSDDRFMKKDMKVTFLAVFLFLAAYVLYAALDLPLAIGANKFPPSPFYVLLGIAVTLVLLSLFISFESLIRGIPRTVLEFFSANSYWLYLWSLVLLFISNFIFSHFGLPLAVRLLLEFLFNCVVLALLVTAQKHVKVRIYIEKSPL